MMAPPHTDLVAIAARIESEALISARPGQCARLESIARHIRRLAAEIPGPEPSDVWLVICAECGARYRFTPEVRKCPHCMSEQESA